jgi:hypothetical protein
MARGYAPRQKQRLSWVKAPPRSFVSKSDATERLYFDIVAVARASDGWELKSGLCKR